MGQLFQNNFTLLVQKNRNFAFAYPFLQAQRIKKQVLKKEKEPKNPNNSKPFKLQKSGFLQNKLEKTKVFFLYGLEGAKAYPFLRDWLKKETSHRLIFLEEDLGSFVPFLKSSLASKLLKDPQVEIHLLPKKNYFKTFAEELALRFFLQRVELISFGKQKNFSYFKKLLEEALIYYSAYMNDKLLFPDLFQNFLANARQLNRSFAVGSLKGAFKKVPAIICGAGPSLALEKEQLKSFKAKSKALIIAGGSAITALSSYGMTPHFGVVIDPNEEEFERLSLVKDKTLPLLYDLRVQAKVLEGFSGPLGCFKSDRDKLTSWLEEKTGVKQERVGEQLNRNSFSVSLVALAIAHFLGCEPIILCGMDLAYSDTFKRYAKGVEAEVKLSSLDLGDLLLEKSNKQGKKVKTLRRFELEAEAFSHFAAGFKKLKIINATSGGLKIKKIPFQPLQEIEKQYLQKFFSIEKKIKENVNKSRFPKKTTALAVNQALDDLNASLIRAEKFLKKVLKRVKTDQFQSSDFKLLIWDLKEELAFELFLSDVEVALEFYLRRFKLPLKERLFQKFSKLKAITTECCKLSACSVESFR